MVPLLKAQDLFDQLHPEQEREAPKKFNVQRKRSLDALVMKFEDLLTRDIRVELPPQYQQNVYRQCRCRSAQRCDAADVVELFKILSAYQDHKEWNLDFYLQKEFSGKLGCFMSYVINHSPDSTFYLTTGHLRLPLHNLGYKNRKNLIVLGNIGDSCFTRMIDGTVTVKGNTQNFLGDELRGGTITIEGDVDGSSLGFRMRGGIINVLGDCELMLQVFADNLTPTGFVQRVMGIHYLLPSTRMVGGTIFYQQHLILENGVFKV